MTIYLDYAATTPQDPAVTKYISDICQDTFGNPSSIHQQGRKSRALVEESRDRIARELGCLSKEIIFTSGGTEANNSIFMSLLGTKKNNRKKILIPATEHASVLEPVRRLTAFGYEIHNIPLNEHGNINREKLPGLIDDKTCLVSVMMVNNETGIVYPVAEISNLCRNRDVLFHTDAVQAFGRIDFSFDSLLADFITISAHKIYGPKGVGALVVRQGVPFFPVFYGGGQESNRRPGTENISGIAGFAKAVDLLSGHRDYQHVLKIRDYFETSLLNTFDQVKIIGKDTDRIPFISNAAFPGNKGDTILYQLDMAGINVSVGSACSSGSLSPSHVIQAMRLPQDIVESAVRFSFGRYSKIAEIDYLIQVLKRIIK
ncbi:MAG: cysteine desulfurase [Calditrichaceae bacterium]|nr:cysteine desulfurase [Calditrichaceae bacterium]